MFDNLPAGQIKHLTQGIVVGEAGFVLGNLPELAVQALDDIGRVYDFPNLGGKSPTARRSKKLIGLPQNLIAYPAEIW